MWAFFVEKSSPCVSWLQTVQLKKTKCNIPTGVSMVEICKATTKLTYYIYHVSQIFGEKNEVKLKWV